MKIKVGNRYKDMCGHKVRIVGKLDTPNSHNYVGFRSTDSVGEVIEQYTINGFNHKNSLRHLVKKL